MKKQLGTLRYRKRIAITLSLKEATILLAKIQIPSFFDHGLESLKERLEKGICKATKWSKL